MNNKIPCKECGKMILPATADKTGGYCMPCNKKFNVNDEPEGIPNLNEVSIDAFGKDPQAALAQALKDQKQFLEEFDDAMDEFGMDELEELVKDFQKKHGRSPDIGEIPDKFKSTPEYLNMAQEVIQLLADIGGDTEGNISERQMTGTSYKSKHIEYMQVKSPVTDHQTKFGGQPVWVTEPEWPTSRSTGEKMSFLGQIVLDSDHFGYLKGKVVYLFMNTNEDADETWNPDGGENAVIVQPGNNTITCIADETGPTVEHAYDSEFDTDGLCEFTVNLSDVDEYEDDEDILMEDKISGIPYWWQNEEYPYRDSIFVTQLGDESVPIDVNFGTGMAYVFINKEGTEGKLLWQC